MRLPSAIFALLLGVLCSLIAGSVSANAPTPVSATPTSPATSSPVPTADTVQSAQAATPSSPATSADDAEPPSTDPAAERSAEHSAGTDPSGAKRSSAPAGIAPRPAEGPVYVIRIDGEIELGLAAYIRRVLRAAEQAEAGAVVLDINTPGGRVDAALDIKDLLLDSPLRSIALVNRQAFSAGALIALAAESIYVVPGSSIGAATPVMGDTGEKASEKMVSALRSAFAATAERRDRNPDIARAMVDESVVVDGLSEAGKLLTLTYNEAIESGIAEGATDSLESLLEALAPQSGAIVRAEPSFMERLVRFVTHPAVAALLMSLGFLGMFFELQTPGWGLGGTVAIVCLGLYFWGHHLAGLAGLESALLIGLGILLMVVEVFFIPGVGVVGFLGLAAFLAGLFMSRMSPWQLPGEFTSAILVMSCSVLLMILGSWAMLTYLPKNKAFSGLVLLSSATSNPKADELATAESTSSLLGRRGLTVTDLRPAGTMRLDGAPVDVVSEGRYIEAGTLVEIISDSGSRRVVRPVEKDPPDRA